MNGEPIKYVYDKTEMTKNTIVFPAFAPDPDTGEGEYIEVFRKKCPAGFLFGLGWGVNRGQKDSTGRAYARLSIASSVVPINGIWRVYRYNPASISVDLVAELDSTELASTVTDRTTWRVFEDTLDLIDENSTLRWFFMSKENSIQTVTKADSEFHFDGYRIIK